MKKAPALPFFISVDDYHEFSGVQSAMQLINPKIKVEEVSTERETLRNTLELDGYYVAIVFEGRKPSNTVVADMLSNKKTKIHAL